MPGLVGDYKLEGAAKEIGDMNVVKDNEYLAIKRDRDRADLVKFEKVYKIYISNKISTCVDRRR